MADDPKDPIKDPKDDKGGQGGGQGVTLESVKAMITEALGKGGGPKGGAAEHDVTAQVEAAVAKVHKGQEAAAVMADLQARLTAVESKKVPEKKPKEYRSITRRIWGGDDDE